MSGSSKSIREIRKMVEREGLTLVSIDRSRRHPQVVVEKNGKRGIFVVCGTPSDKRSMLNIRADMRRFAREHEPER